MLEFIRASLTYLIRRYKAQAGISQKQSALRVLLHYLITGRRRGLLLLPKGKFFSANRSLGIHFSFPTTRDGEAGKKSETTAISAIVRNEVRALAKLDPSVLSMGREQFDKAPIFFSDDVWGNSGFFPVETAKLLMSEFDSVVVVPHFVIGGADKYTAALVSALTDFNKRVLVVATLQESFIPGNIAGTVLEGYGKATLRTWASINSAMELREDYLARFLHALSPREIFVINSELGLDMLVKFGTALSNKSKIYTYFFSMDTDTFIAQYGVRYARILPKQIEIASDNQVTISKLRNFDATNRIFHCIPAPVEIPHEETYATKIETRRTRDKTKKIIWISRVEKFKGTEILSNLADELEEYEFHVFGPLQTESRRSLGLRKRNIVYKGEKHISQIDFSLYDCFIFTSLFEGNPNVVLEVACEAIPIVSTDVGSLSTQFSSNQVHFVPLNSDPRTVAAGFRDAIVKLEKLDSSQSEEYLISLFQNVNRNNSTEVFHEGLKRMIH
jgi:glycosyltransferase involved in cell wall biosynthesis